MSDKTNILFDDRDNEKVSKLLDAAKSFKYNDLDTVYKTLLNNFSEEVKKKITVVLFANYLSLDFIKWNPIKDKVELFNIKAKKEVKKFTFLNFFKKQKKDKTAKSESSEKKYTELYINIGKDKKIYPRDLLHFICTSMKIDSQDIKNIRIFEKFSFFQIPTELCEKAIVLLSVKKARGKTIRVNYSKNESSAD